MPIPVNVNWPGGRRPRRSRARRRQSSGGCRRWRGAGDLDGQGPGRWVRTQLPAGWLTHAHGHPRTMVALPGQARKSSATWPPSSKLPHRIALIQAALQRRRYDGRTQSGHGARSTPDALDASEPPFGAFGCRGRPTAAAHISESSGQPAVMAGGACCSQAVVVSAGLVIAPRRRGVLGIAGGYADMVSKALDGKARHSPTSASRPLPPGVPSG